MNKYLLTTALLTSFFQIKAQKKETIDTISVIWMNKCDTIPGGITLGDKMHCGNAVRIDSRVAFIIDCATKKRVKDSCGITYMY